MKAKIAIISGILLGLGGSFVYVLHSSQARPFISSPVPVEASPTATPMPLATWNDPNGFTFQYPSDVSVNKHDEDTVNYAHIEMTNSRHPGTVIVWAKDTAMADVSLWTRNEKRFSNANILDTTLGGEPGKKIMLSGSVPSAVVAAVKDNIIFTIEGEFTDETYWSKVQGVIADSFVFTVPTDTTTKSQPSDTGGGADTSSDEEVLE